MTPGQAFTETAEAMRFLTLQSLVSVQRDAINLQQKTLEFQKDLTLRQKCLQVILEKDSDPTLKRKVENLLNLINSIEEVVKEYQEANTKCIGIELTD